MASVTEMPASEAAETPEIPPVSDSEQAKPAKHKGGRGLKKPPELNPAFFKRVASIPQEEWGSRAFMYVYITEPVCVAKTWGKESYAVKSSEPILDLEPVKEQFGSCKGWLSLNVRKSGVGQTDQIDRHDFQILDPTCPPKIARGSWANDDRNDKWKALLPPEPQPASVAAQQLLDGVNLYKTIKQDLKEESPSAPEPVNSTRDTLETMKLAKELFATPAPAEVPKIADPLAIATELAKTFMQMKADNPMVDFLTKQMDRQHEEMMAMRKELTEARKQQEEKPKGLLDQIFELAGDDTKLDRLKKVAGMFGFSAESGGGRAPRTSALDVARELVNSPFGAQLGAGLGALFERLAAPAQNGPQPMQPQPQVLNPVPPGAQTNGTTHETQQQRITRIAATITRPMIDEFFDQDTTGDIFAERIYDLWPDDLKFLRTIGPDTIVNLYKQYNPQLWQHITQSRGDREPQFRAFVTAFLAWRSEDEEPEPIAATATASTDDDDFGKGENA